MLEAATQAAPETPAFDPEAAREILDALYDAMIADDAAEATADVARSDTDADLMAARNAAVDFQTAVRNLGLAVYRNRDAMRAWLEPPSAPAPERRRPVNDEAPQPQLQGLIDAVRAFQGTRRLSTSLHGFEGSMATARARLVGAAEMLVAAIDDADAADAQGGDDE